MAGIYGQAYTVNQRIGLASVRHVLNAFSPQLLLMDQNVTGPSSAIRSASSNRQSYPGGAQHHVVDRLSAYPRRHWPDSAPVWMRSPVSARGKAGPTSTTTPCAFLDLAGPVGSAVPPRISQENQRALQGRKNSHFTRSYVPWYGFNAAVALMGPVIDFGVGSSAERQSHQRPAPSGGLEEIVRDGAAAANEKLHDVPHRRDTLTAACTAAAGITNINDIAGVRPNVSIHCQSRASITRDHHRDPRRRHDQSSALLGAGGRHLCRRASISTGAGRCLRCWVDLRHIDGAARHRRHALWPQHALWRGRNSLVTHDPTGVFRRDIQPLRHL